ncbi:hypothetical protein ACMD2_03891 [Ananas comosus]|uniref:Uncharacterized protein n=1 Tax=Ananas comosus TaxID=4615 RepID=A0A199W5B6_ANACO|nr:hypothetical protein ACMD2_03891 [Ananas comosus]
MAVNNRAKRVTDPLDANVRARLRGEVTAYASSGSDHDSAPCLSGLVHAFLLQNPPSSEDDGGDLEERERKEEEEEEEEEGEEDGGAADRAAAAAMRELLDPPAESDPFRIRLAAAAAAEEAWLRRGGRGGGGARLEGPGVSAGSYEYIDVVVAASAAEKNVKGSSRYIVDAEVAAGLEVARATEGYGRVVGAVPALVVARAEAVGRAVRVAAAAARRSLRRQGLHVPPWRKPRYLLAKWLGPYRRTTNPWPSSSSSSSSSSAAAAEVKCRAVGFFPAGSGGFRLAPVARTR